MLKIILGSHSKRRFTMFPLRNFLTFAVAGAIFALSAATHSPYAETLVALSAPTNPASADEMVQNLGPVRPHEPILATVGSKRVIAFYEADSGSCAVHVVVWNPTDINAESTVSFQATLSPRQTTQINTAEHKPLTLKCGDYAQTLASVDTDQKVVSK
jgi:hypothetical protein